MKKLLVLLVSFNLFGCKDKTIDEKTTITYCKKNKTKTTKLYRKTISDIKVVEENKLIVEKL